MTAAEGPQLPPTLLAWTPGEGPTAQPGRLVAAVRSAVGAGLTGLVLREPDVADGPFLELAMELRQVLGPRGWLGLHDRAHLVAAAKADGLHLGWRSLPVMEARQVVGSSVAIGVSDHVGDDPNGRSNADYRTLGPLHATPSKEGLVEPLGLDGLPAPLEAATTPTWILGGVNPEDAPAVRRHGASGIAVLRGVLRQEDPAGAVRRYLDAWGPA